MIVHVATADLSTVMMLIGQLESLDGFTISGVAMPVWRMEDGKPTFETKYALNAYVVLDVAKRPAAEAWVEEWADYVRTDLKNAFSDVEYEWIDARVAASR